eukprot:g10067.t1
MSQPAESSSSIRSSARSASTTVEQQAQEEHHVPRFQPIDVDKARARAAIEQWRTFTMLLEPQPGSPEASSACEHIMKLSIGEQNGESNRTRFTLITKDSLAEIAKQNSISGKRALAQALVWRMSRDREEGLALKKDKAVQDNEKDIYIREEYTESTINEGAQLLGELDDRDDTKSGDDSTHEAAAGGADDSDNKQGVEDEEQDLEAIAREQAERERAKLELRAARLLTQVDDDLGAPDRVYILKGFPATETDAAQFLEENNAFYTAPTKKRKSAASPPLAGKPDNRPAFLSCLDAVVQLTTRELVGPPDASPGAFSGRAESRPGTASSVGSARSARSARDEQPNSPRGRWREVDEIVDSRKRESAWDKLRTTDAPNPFTQASGATKALAVAQTKGGTVWQDLSFCYINIMTPLDPTKEESVVRPSSSERKGEKTPAKGARTLTGEIKGILELVTEFKEMVTQMAFEKFDFHQWFSTAEVVTIPRKERGVDIARAIAEAQRAAIGPLGSSSGANGSPARVKGSLWGTDQALLAYSDLMLAVPDELSSMATTLHCMVEAVMLECTGATPRSLDTSPPAPLSRATTINETTAVAPLSDACLGAVSLEDHLGERTSDTEDGSLTEGTDVSAFASTEGPMSCPLARNVTLEFGDFVGERVTRAALNRAAAIGEGRIDPRAVVAVERAAIAKLQNPRVVGQGALPRLPERSEKDRGTEQCELLTFTDLGRKDVDRTRQVWSLAELVNARHSPQGQGEKWSFEDRRYWDVLPPHVVQQILRAENGTEPLCLRKYYPPTDELLVALHHESPPGRARICLWDPCTSGSIPCTFRPSFKDWAKTIIARDSSYTPRTLLALGALMDVSKADLDRAKTKSIKLFPADHSLVVLTGFVATLERWLSVFKDGHVMGLRLAERPADTSENTPPGDGAVGMKFVLDSKRSSSGKILDGFVPEAAKDEYSRAVVGKGTVVRYMRDGSTQMLFATGDVVTRNGDETILTDKNGRRFMKAGIASSAGTHVATLAPPVKGKASQTTEAVPTADGTDAPSKEWIPIQPLSSATANKSGKKNTNSEAKHGGSATQKAGSGLSNSSDVETPMRDAESGALVWASPRGNGSVVVVYEDGLTVTRHIDGTVQRWRRGDGGGHSVDSGLVLVECPGFASIEVDIEIQEMCSDHATGKPVTVTRGGNRARLRAVMPNGGVTLVIANDKGEVVVRPRGLWEGKPVHAVLAGPNSSMPPNCEQPDLLVGAYSFDCLRGVMEAEDTDRNRFVLDVTKTAFLREGFSFSRVGGSAADGSNSPTASSEKGEKSKRGSTRPSNAQRNLIGDGAGRRSAGGVTSGVDVMEHECCSDPHSQDARQLSFYVPLSPMPRGEGSFATLLRNRRDQVFGDDYDYGGVGGGGNDDISATSNWRIRPLPFVARINLGTANIGIPARGHSTPPEACIRRVWLEHPPLSAKALEELKRALVEWEAWKQSRAEQIDRFFVSDPRPAADVEAQRSVQKLIRKAFREAKVAKLKAREKARAARAQAAKEQQAARKKAGLSGSRAGTAATTSTLSQGEQSTVPSTFGEFNLLDSEEDGDTDDMDFPDSDEEEEDDETALLRQEAASAFASAGGSPEGYLKIRQLRIAMIMVLGRAVKESEAESRLHALRERRLPRQTQGKYVKEQPDPAKVSQQDLFHILLGIRNDSPVPSGTMEAVLEHTNATQSTKNEGDVPGGEPMEHMMAQGNSTRAVRSLLRMGGGRGEEESGATGREALTTTSKTGGALTGTYVANSCAFQVTPSSVSLGAIRIGCPVPLKLEVANVGDKPARFRVDYDGGERCVTVTSYAKGPVAAGLAVVVSLEVLPRRHGVVREVVRIVAEDGIAEAVITGEASHH